MKKTLTKALSLILTACFIMSLCVCTTAMAADESIAEKTLKYFDGTWTDWSGTDAANQTLKCTLPEGISSLYFNNLSVSKAAKVTEINGKSAEDASLKLYTNGSGAKREFGANLFECSDAASAPANIAKDDKFTVYVDFSVDSIPASLGYFGMRVLGRKDANTASNNYTTIFNISPNGESAYTISAGEGTKTYNLKDWVSMAAEIEYTSANSVKCNIYADGVLLGTTSETSLSGLSFVRLGFQTSSSGSYGPVMYVDNVAFYTGAFSQDRYNAIEAASALSVADIIGNNTDLSSVEKNLTLIKGKNDSTITWASSNEAVISTSGVVTPSATEDTEVTLTATVTNGTASETKAYTVTVPKNELITFDEIKGKNLYEGSIVSNLVLPAKLRNETEIYWTSSNENVIATNGSVTRNNDASYSVTLTAKKASDDSVVKEFNLYVIGDDIVNDDASNFDKVASRHDNVRLANDSHYRFSAFAVTDINTEANIVYEAAPGANVQVNAGWNYRSRTVQLWYSADGENYTMLDSNAFAITDSDEYEFAIAGGWNKDVWETATALPEGTRYIKVRAGSLNGAIIDSVKITNNTEADVTFADIANGNAAADKVMSNLDLSSLESVESSDTTIIAENGTVTRPEKDTVVTLTAKINNDSVTATKKFTLTVLGTKEAPKSEKPWLFHNNGTVTKRIDDSTYKLAKDGKIEFNADVFYAGNEAKTAIGIIAIYDSTGKILEIKTADLPLTANSTEKQRVSTVLTLTKDSYTGAKVRGFIWDKGTLNSIGEKNDMYTAK